MLLLNKLSALPAAMTLCLLGGCAAAKPVYLRATADQVATFDSGKSVAVLPHDPNELQERNLVHVIRALLVQQGFKLGDAARYDYVLTVDRSTATAPIVHSENVTINSQSTITSGGQSGRVSTSGVASVPVERDVTFRVIALALRDRAAPKEASVIWTGAVTGRSEVVEGHEGAILRELLQQIGKTTPTRKIDISGLSEPSFLISPSAVTADEGMQSSQSKWVVPRAAKLSWHMCMQRTAVQLDDQITSADAVARSVAAQCRTLRQDFMEEVAASKGVPDLAETPSMREDEIRLATTTVLEQRADRRAGKKEDLPRMSADSDYRVAVARMHEVNEGMFGDLTAELYVRQAASQGHHEARCLLADFYFAHAFEGDNEAKGRFYIERMTRMLNSDAKSGSPCATKTLKEYRRLLDGG